MYRNVIPGKKISVQVLNRQLAKTVAPSEPYVIISITDENKCDAKLAKSRHCMGVLRLKFADIEAPYESYRLFQNKDARRILKFVKEHESKIECIVTHCEAGVSRSAAVAAALSKLINGESEQVFKYYRPNKLVYKTILDVADDGSDDGEKPE